jgi:hypothetical protein
LPVREDLELRAGLERLGRAYHGWVGFWVADLSTGRYAGWNSEARFPAASTVKLGVIAAGIRRFGHGPRSPIDYELRQIGAWSSNLAANRIFALVGGALPTESALRRLGMSSSTYPWAFRVGTSVRDAPKPPPSTSARVTTARDLGRALLRLQAAAAGQRWAVAQTGLTRAAASAALGYLSLAWDGSSLLAFPSETRVVEKDGWTNDVRASAALAYLPSGPRIVVVLIYRPDVPYSEARELGRKASRLALQ